MTDLESLKAEIAGLRQSIETLSREALTQIALRHRVEKQERDLATLANGVGIFQLQLASYASHNKLIATALGLDVVAAQAGGAGVPKH